jgi:hypothetical protein
MYNTIWVQGFATDETVPSTTLDLVLPKYFKCSYGCHVGLLLEVFLIAFAKWDPIRYRLSARLDTLSVEGILAKVGECVVYGALVTPGK